jgi:hypothetical protein
MATGVVEARRKQWHKADDLGCPLTRPLSGKKRTTNTQGERAEPSDGLRACHSELAIGLVKARHRLLLARDDSACGARATRDPYDLRRTNCFVWGQRQLNLDSASPPLCGDKEVEVERIVLPAGYLQLE